MCGICGILDLSSPAGLGLQVQEMSALAEHRGPDDSGLVTFDPNGRVLYDGAAGCDQLIRGDIRHNAAAALGHRRLSIIDLSPAGHQPMHDGSGRFWMVYNGEVYNYRELRTELEGLGRAFRSSTDSEVVLHAYSQWGASCLQRFNGMWAFAVYDREDGSLFCARDRYGIKPLYYSKQPGRFAFASEAKQLIGLPWVGARANQSLLADFFLWGLENHTDECFFAGVRQVPGSHYLELSRQDLEQGNIQPVRYWRPDPVQPGSERRAVEEFRELLFDSVRLRLRSDVPVGVTLSGGLDSSSVVCVAGEHRRLQGDSSSFDAFNVEFEGEAYSERGFAEAAATKAGARSIVLQPRQTDLARDWSRFIWHMEQPVGGLSYFSNFQIYRLIREHGIPVVLSGQGGDELLLGYERYRAYDGLFALKTGGRLAALNEIWNARRHSNMPLTKQLAYGLYFSFPALRAARRRRLVRPILNRGFYHDYAGHSEHLLISSVHRDPHALQASELFRYQLPHLLHHEDRMSMAHSVETRLPFLDFRLLELVLGQPSSLLYRDGWSKYLLRQAMRGILPDEVRNRTDKMGYETPSGRLIRRNRALFLPLLRRHAGDPILDTNAIEKKFDSEQLDERLLCSAISYLSWKETFAAA